MWKFSGKFAEMLRKFAEMRKFAEIFLQWPLPERPRLLSELLTEASVRGELEEVVGGWIISLASRKRCDFENAETLRFEIAPPKKSGDFLFLKVWAPSTCRCCFTGKKHCDLEFAIWKRSDLRFHSAIFLRFFCGTCGESCDFKFAILKRSDCDCDFLGR